jgi:hypothetical protein
MESDSIIQSGHPKQFKFLWIEELDTSVVKRNGRFLA